MFSFNVNGKDYKVRFGYRVLSETDLIDRVVNISKLADTSEHPFQDMMKTVAELLLAGLQKKHRSEFGYETDKEKKEAFDKIYDLMDDYEDESTEDNPQNCYTLFGLLQAELEKNGFLSGMQHELAKAAAEQSDATKMPQDHKTKA